MPNNRVSVIIPTLNEEKALPKLFDTLSSLDPQPYEIIFVDGPSKDETSNLIQEKGYRLIRSIAKGRALQINEGAFQAAGDHLVFLHADTILPENAVNIVTSTLEEDHIKLAGFTSRLQSKVKLRTFVSFQNWLRTYFGAFFYSPIRCLCFGFRLLRGDQAMFCRRKDFIEVGGYNQDLPVLEDADLCFKLNKLGCIKLIRDRVYSSDRRIAKLGILNAQLRYLRLYMYYRFGVSTKWLKSQYEEIR